MHYPDAKVILSVRDPKSWYASYSKTIKVFRETEMPPDAPRRVGKAEIRRGMRSQFDLFDTTKMVVHMEEVRILGEWAYSHGSYEFELVPKGGGETKYYSGNFLDILEKQVDDSWKIAIDCRNYTMPLE